ncbi:glycoside hydrolase domain-containing protein [Paenibacillus mendelii]|uniref:Glycoside hydrolase domain-containing protein n=1 Tax=Paenibacillus mendelii TaxID=206163 RepID=A0ABV6JC64_9BACL|nr:glycoside hydrolase domain-containing protein [Paenibacillus mendelii]MCQ6561498.1 S-layer homology domain-containing protein [Paenibacillus mendelii]
MLRYKKITVYLCTMLMIFSGINIGYASAGDPQAPPPANIASLANSVHADDQLVSTPTFQYGDAQWGANWYPFGVNVANNAPGKIIDCDPSSYFISQKGADFASGPRYITLGWNQAQTFNTAVFAAEYAKARGIKEYNIETTVDGTTWVPVFGTNQTLAWQYFLGPDSKPVVERLKVSFDTQENIVGARIAIYSVYTEEANGDYALNEFELYFDEAHNTPPYFDSLRGQSVPVGRVSSFPVKASAFDGHSISYALTIGVPAWAAIDSGSGVMTITNPAAADAGNHILTVIATDNVTGASAEQAVSLTVTELTNIARLASAIDSPGKLTADYSLPAGYYKKQAGEPYWYPAGTSYVNNAPDKMIDGDKTTFFVSKINTDMGGEPSSDKPHYISLAWNEPQTLNEFVFTADFGNQKSILTYNIEVTKDNQTWTKLFSAPQRLDWKYSIYNFSNGPNPADFTETIKVKVPAQNDVRGARVVIITAPDTNWGQAPGRSYWLNELEIYNNPAYNIPEFTAIGDKTFKKNTAVSFKVYAYANKTPVIYSLTEAPDGMTIDGQSGIISWTAPNSAGEYTAVVRATSSTLSTAFAEMTIPIHVTDSDVTDVWTVSSIQPIYEADIKPDGAVTDHYQFVMAKHEYESAQIAIRSSTDFNIHKVAFSGLVSGNNAIDSSNFKYGFPEYRIPDVALPSEFNYIHNKETANLYPGSSVDQLPDPISNEQSADVATNTTQPVFFTLYVPKDAAPGAYTGTVTLQTSLGDMVFDVGVEVADVTIPDITESALTVYNWTAIYGHTREKTDFINQYYGAEKYSEEWWSIIGNFAQNLADYRSNMHMMKPMPFLSDHGYNLNSFMGDAPPVIPDEAWAEFDRYIQIFIDSGVTRFSLDHLVDKVIQVVGADENWNTYDRSLINEDGTIDAGTLPDTDKFITNYLTAVSAHLKAKGWLDEFKWYAHIFDEPNVARPGSLLWWSYAAKLVKKTVPEFTIGDAGLVYYYPEQVETYVPEMNEYYLAKDKFDSWYETYKDDGKEKWAYSLGFDPALNRLTSTPTLASRLVFWDYRRNDLTGYLHWSWNGWWDGEFVGDTYEVYPDAAHKTVKSSLRYEAQRDGIEEYELLSKLKTSNPSLANEILSTALKSGTKYTLDVNYIKTLHDYMVKAAAGQTVGSIPAQPKPFVEVVSGSELINDTDSRVEYVGTGWTKVTSPNQINNGINLTKADRAYENNVSTTTVDGDYAELEFYGYGINVYAEKNRSMGLVDIYIDGVLTSTVDAHEDVLYRFYPIYTNYNLTDGPHTIKVVNRENENNQNRDRTNKRFLVLDAFRVYSSTDPAKQNELASVSVTGGELNRDFASYVMNYDMEIKHDQEVVTLKPAAINPNAKITVNGTKVKKDGKVTVYPQIGKNVVKMTVEYNGASKEYVFNIIRLSANMALTAEASADNAITPDYVQTGTGFNYGVGEHKAAERSPSKITDGNKETFFITKLRYDYDGYIDDATSQRWAFVDGIEQRRYYTQGGQPITYYITLNWDDPQTFDTLRLFTQYSMAWGIHRYNIETTSDGSTWEPVFAEPKYFSYTTISSGEKEQKDVLLPVQTDKRGVRLAITAASFWGSEAYALNEWEVYFTSEVQPKIEVEKDPDTGGGTVTVVQPPTGAVITPAAAPGEPVVVTVEKPVLDASTSEAAAAVTADTVAKAMGMAEADSATGVKTVEIVVPATAGATAYFLQLPAMALSSGHADEVYRIITGLGTVSIPGTMLRESEAAGAQYAGLVIANADTAKLSSTLQQQIGVHPVIELSLRIDGSARAWSNPAVPVTVSIPYTPTAEELKNPEHIVIGYIDEAGQFVAVPTGKYDPASGKVSFTTTQLGQYAIAFVKKTFADTANYAWAKKAIEVLASKGVINGISDRQFAPSQAVRRADFVLLLVKALGLTAASEQQFSDVKSTAYYAEALGIAKTLGIATGVGGNQFNPDTPISRQEMMVLITRAMTIAGKKLPAGAASDLAGFADQGSIAPFAADSIAALVKSGIVTGSEGKINPVGHASRAETAVLIYRIYNMQH